jgi:CRP-like cAMP-binding protein
MTTSQLFRKLCDGGGLNTGDIALLQASIFAARTMKAGEDIVRAGGPPGSVILVTEGVACRRQPLPDGKHAITAILLPGDFCNLHALILGHMCHGIAALTDCAVVEMPARTIDHLMRVNPRIARALWRSMLADEAVLRAWLVNIGQRPSDRKVAHLLCELRLRLHSVGLATPQSMRLPMRQKELAEMLGLAKEYLNRVLRDLQQAGLLAVEGREIFFPALSRLEEFAGFEPDYLDLPRRGFHPAGDGFQRTAAE